jgi:hypothetical protein
VTYWRAAMGPAMCPEPDCGEVRPTIASVIHHMESQHGLRDVREQSRVAWSLRAQIGARTPVGMVRGGRNRG